MLESFFMTQFPSVPLEFPKLANAQPSNFGPLRIFFKKGYICCIARSAGIRSIFSIGLEKYDHVYLDLDCY